MRFTGLPSWTVLALIAGSAGVLALLHLLRVRPREVRVVTTLFWAHAVERTRARTLLERFRHPWVYALLLLISLLLVLAMGRPEGTTAAEKQVHEVIVLDAGASMSAPDGNGRTRLDAARDAVLGEMNRLAAGDGVALVVADPWPRLAAGFDALRPVLKARLASVTAAEVPSSRGAGLSLARSLLVGKSRSQIVVVTDRMLEWKNDPGVEGRTVRVGQPASNAAIISAQFEPDAANPLTGRFAVRVAYSGEKPEAISVVVQRAGGAPLLNASQTLAPGSTRDFTASGVPADGDWLIVRLGPADAVAADDSVRFHLPLRTPIRVAVGGELPEPVRIAMTSDPAVRLVAAGQPGDIDALVDPGSRSFSRPTLLLRSEGVAMNAGDLGRVGTDGGGLTRGLDFEGAACGTGLAAGPWGTLNCGQYPVATLDLNSRFPQLTLGSALWTGNAPRKAAFAIFISRGLRRLAGWDEDPVVLAPERVAEDPLWTRREKLGGDTAVMPVSREAADLSRPVAAGVGSREGIPAGDGYEKGFSYQQGGGGSRWGVPAFFEILLILAIAFFLLEAFLHARGRIS